jgi:superoxide dismutase, Fe-Mn family
MEMVHELPDLPYAFDALEPYIDAKTMEIHHGKHHAGYVKKLNAALEGHADLQGKSVEELLANNLEIVPEEIKTAVRNNGGGYANHSLFWQIMAPEGKGGKPSEELLGAMKEAFGSGQGCHDKFVEAAGKLFGSGWVWIVVSNGKLDIITTANQDSPLSLGMKPILGLDVWEHAYYIHYFNRRDEYINAFTKVINWTKVSELYEKAIS